MRRVWLKCNALPLDLQFLKYCSGHLAFELNCDDNDNGCWSGAAHVHYGGTIAFYPHYCVNGHLRTFVEELLYWWPCSYSASFSGASGTLYIGGGCPRGSSHYFHQIRTQGPKKDVTEQLSFVQTAVGRKMSHAAKDSSPLFLGCILYPRS